MKTSTFLASMLFGLAVAAPVERRARHTKTEIITTTVFSTVTVYDDEPAPTSSQGLFYEQPPTPSSVAATSTYTPVAAPPVVSKPAVVAPASSAAAPAPVSSAPAAPVVPSVAAPAPAVTSAAAPPPAPVIPVTPPTSSAAPVYTPPTTSNPAPSTGSAQHSDVDLTMYNGYGGKGACGTTLNDSDIFVALSQGVFGASTYDVMTGDATNPWCKATIQITANGKTVTAPVVDRCAGCAGTYDVDLSPAAYTALGLDASAPGRSKASWSKVS